MPPNHGEEIINAQNVDLSNCDREQVQFREAIRHIDHVHSYPPRRVRPCRNPRLLHLTFAIVKNTF